MAQNSADNKNEFVIWLGRKLEVMTSLKITTEGVCWNTLKEKYCVGFKEIIGCKIIQEANRSFDMVFYDDKSFKLVNHEFSAVNSKQALQLTAILNSLLYESTKRRLCIITNPISGNKKGVKVLEKRLFPLLRYTPHTFEHFFTTHSNFIEDLVRDTNFSKFTDVVCLGGDGTMQQCINSINKYQSSLLSILRFGIIPVGSRNALACELSGKSLDSSILHILKGISFTGDLMKAKIKDKELLATTAISWGLISDVTDEAQHLRRFGAMRYNVVAFKRAFSKWKAYAAAISFESQTGQILTVKSEFVFAVIANHRVPNQENSEIVAPAAKICSGQLELMIVNQMSRARSLKMFLKMQDHGAHVNCAEVAFFKTNCVKIEPIALMVFNVDGEIHYGDSITVEVLPNVLRYIGKPCYLGE